MLSDYDSNLAMQEIQQERIYEAQEAERARIQSTYGCQVCTEGRVCLCGEHVYCTNLDETYRLVQGGWLHPFTTGSDCDGFEIDENLLELMED